jgi:hypothetical protein
MNYDTIEKRLADNKLKVMMLEIAPPIKHENGAKSAKTKNQIRVTKNANRHFCLTIIDKSSNAKINKRKRNAV